MMFLIKQNDRLPEFAAFLKTKAGNADAQPVDLTGATVAFKMRLPGSPTLKVDAPATIVDAIQGEVSYAWAVGDTDTTGLYQAEFEVTFAGGATFSFPTQGFLQVQVLASF